MSEMEYVGLNAGAVWRTLNQIGFISIGELSRKLDLGFQEVSLAVGWLAREDKVLFRRQNGILYVRNKP